MTLDLVVVVSDKDTEQALGALLGRHHSLGMRPISYEIKVHPHKDPGCYKTGDQLAAVFIREASHALVVFDCSWEGAPPGGVDQLEADVEGRLQSLWGERARCVVIDPELEAWVWSDSPHVMDVLGWRGRDPALRAWLEDEGLWPADHPKPPDPKAALRRALRVAQLPPSSSLFRQLAERVGLERCRDPAFLRLGSVLRGWFALQGPELGTAWLLR